MTVVIRSIFCIVITLVTENITLTKGMRILCLPSNHNLTHGLDKCNTAAPVCTHCKPNLCILGIEPRLLVADSNWMVLRSPNKAIPLYRCFRQLSWIFGHRPPFSLPGVSIYPSLYYFPCLPVEFPNGAWKENTLIWLLTLSFSCEAAAVALSGLAIKQEWCRVC
jgi:hypothetical protein